MKISTMMHSTALEAEDRKRALQRREMGEAYKRSSKFVEASKNPVLAALENLISGKTEKDLLAADKVTDKQTLETKLEHLESPKVKKEMESLKRSGQEIIAPEQAYKPTSSSVPGELSSSYTKGLDDQHAIVDAEVALDTRTGAIHEETISILEMVQQSALAPAQPSPQDLRVAESAAAQIQQTRAEMLGTTIEEADTEPFAKEDLAVEIPERFQQSVERDANEPTVFGKEYKQIKFEMLFNRATSKYASHIAMVKNGYQPFVEPVFSRIA